MGSESMCQPNFLLGKLSEHHDVHSERHIDDRRGAHQRVAWEVMISLCPLGKLSFAEVMIVYLPIRLSTIRLCGSKSFVVGGDSGSCQVPNCTTLSLTLCGTGITPRFRTSEAKPARELCITIWIYSYYFTVFKHGCAADNAMLYYPCQRKCHQMRNHCALEYR